MWIVRHKLMAMAGGLTFLIVILLALVVFPLYQNATKLLAKIEVKSTELESITNKVSLLSKLDPNVLAERVSVLDSALPPRKDVLLYLASIEGLSKELGLTFGGLSLTPGDLNEASGSAKKVAKREVGLQSLETEIKMRGGEENVYVFLRSIENVLPLMQIKDIKVAILGGDQYSLTLTLGMLWAPNSTVDVKGQVTLFGQEEEKYFTQLSEFRKFDSISGSLAEQPSLAKDDLFAPFEASSPILLP